MAQPTAGDLHVNRPLTNISIAYVQSEANFISTKAGPVIPVQKQTDSYFKFKKGAFYKDDMKVRAPGAESAGGGYDMDTPDTYYCPVYAFHTDIPDQVRANADDPLNVDRAATNRVTRTALTRRERVFATNLLSSSSGWDTKLAGVANGSYVDGTNLIKWSDYTNSNPLTDVAEYQTKVALANGGFRPKKAVMSRTVWDKLKNHPAILARITGGATTEIPAQILQKLVASLMELDSMLVMDSVYDASNEGGTWNPAWIAGDTFLLYYTPEVASLETPSAFYGFGWVGMMGMSATGDRIKKFRMEPNGSDRVEIESSFDFKLVGSDMAALFYNLL